MSNAAVLEEQIAIRVEGGWTILGKSDIRVVPPDDADELSPGEKLERLKAKARRRAATRPMYNDLPESVQDLHDNVMAAMPLQLRVIANTAD